VLINVLLRSIFEH